MYVLRMHWDLGMSELLIIRLGSWQLHLILPPPSPRPRPSPSPSPVPEVTLYNVILQFSFSFQFWFVFLFDSGTQFISKRKADSCFLLFLFCFLKTSSLATFYLFYLFDLYSEISRILQKLSYPFRAKLCATISSHCISLN